MASCSDLVADSLYPKLVSAKRNGRSIDIDLIRGLVERSAEMILELEELDAPIAQIIVRASGLLEQRFDVDIGIPVILDRSGVKPWLSKQRMNITWHHWELYEKHLLTKKNPLPDTTVTRLGEVTDQILDRLGNPADDGAWSRRGLVIGSVQSGKTGNFIGLISKAADAGYKFIVVLAGLHNILREQTQQRIDEGFIGVETRGDSTSIDGGRIGVGLLRREDQHRPSYLTTRDLDFNKVTRAIPPAIGADFPPVVAVVKKNGAVLEHLKEMLKKNFGIGDNSSKQIDVPMLLIDDEADNASINTSTKPDKVTVINGRIRDLLGLFRRRSYVGFTATPFANIFISPKRFDNKIVEDDLFPRDFIMSLPKPTNYVGPSEYFPADGELDLVVEITDHGETVELKHKADQEVLSLAPSLEEAVVTFILARAIRLFRDHINEHHSMLVNVSFYTQVQNQIALLLKGYLNKLRRAITVHSSLPLIYALNDPELSKFNDVFAKHYGHLEHEGSALTFEMLLPLLKESIGEVEVITVNRESDDSATYDSHPEGRSVIAVGGISLSRGFTLEGLIVSYFARSTKMYDTLMQMGRWFGYRDGYRDVCRLFMPPESIDWYSFIARSIDELNAQIGEMKRLGRSPMEFGLRVRQHPAGLLVTAKNKLGSASDETRYLSLWGCLEEITKLYIDSEINRSNINLTKSFIGRLKNVPYIDETHIYEKLHIKSWKNVPSELIGDYVRNFTMPERGTVPKEFLCDFINELKSIPCEACRHWEVVVFSLKGENALAPWRKNLISVDIGSGVSPVAKGRTAHLVESNTFAFANSRIGDSGFEKNFLPDKGKQADYEYAEEQKEEKKVRQTPDSRYRSKRHHPVLTIYPIAAGLRRQGQSAKSVTPEIIHENGTISFSVSFPHAPSSDIEQATLVKYKVNEIYQKFGQVLLQDDEDDFSDEE